MRSDVAAFMERSTGNSREIENSFPEFSVVTGEGVWQGKRPQLWRLQYGWFGPYYMPQASRAVRAAKVSLRTADLLGAKSLEFAINHGYIREALAIEAPAFNFCAW